MCEYFTVHLGKWNESEDYGGLGRHGGGHVCCVHVRVHVRRDGGGHAIFGDPLPLHQREKEEEERRRSLECSDLLYSSEKA